MGVICFTSTYIDKLFFFSEATEHRLLKLGLKYCLGTSTNIVRIIPLGSLLFLPKGHFLPKNKKENLKVSSASQGLKF